MTGPIDAVPGQERTFTLTASTLDPPTGTPSYTFAIDWNGDGVGDQTITGPSGIQVTHAFPDFGTFMIRVIATDTEGVSSLPSRHEIQITNVAPQGDDLLVAGTAGDDTVVINPAGGAGQVEVVVNGLSYGPFAVAGQILVNGGEGSDTYTVNLGDWTGTVAIDDSGTGVDDTDGLFVNCTSDADAVVKTETTIAWGVDASGTADENTAVRLIIDYQEIEPVLIDLREANDYIDDPGGNTMILGGPGNDTILIERHVGWWHRRQRRPGQRRLRHHLRGLEWVRSMSSIPVTLRSQTA